MTDSLLFSPYDRGGLRLKNRVVMAPLTRSRAPGNVPNALMAQYYAQRTEAGLIITEGTSPSPNGLGYARIPGLFNAEQVAGWRAITRAVHADGSKIFVQLMHTGRVGHPSNLPAGARILAPAALAAPGTIFTDQHGAQALPQPQAMTEADIEQTLTEFVVAAKLAMDAGFDGVELHGANGYLIDQFFNTASNTRQDAWGGSVAGRVRFAGELARRTAAAIGAGRVGMRVSPYGAFNGMVPDAEMDAVFESIARQLSALGCAYIHIVDHSSMGAPEVKPAIKASLRTLFAGTYILSGGYTDRTRAEADLRAGKGDLVAFGRPFIANPRLVTKLKAGRPLETPDPSTFYSPGEKGYVDYPL